MTTARRMTVLAAAAALLAGCGGDERAGSAPDDLSPAEEGLRQARDVTKDDFPAPKGRTLQEMADIADPGAEAALAVSEFVPGTNRLSFGMISEDRRFVYGKTAVYLGRNANSPATGPYPAPADSLLVDPAFRSATEPGEDIEAIYSATVPFKRPGKYEALVVTKSGGKLIGAPTVFKVKRKSKIPAVGERPPAVATDTLTSAAGNIEAIDTRVPNDDMHATSFKDVVGKKPVALLFATPALCQSRVCGPVVDIAEQLQSQYGDRMEFIHQEVYVENEPGKGLRPPVKAFNLESEPWLFVIDQDGRVAARLEGSFGVEEFGRAVEAGLDG